MIVAVTGHRPPRLNLGYSRFDLEPLLDFAGRVLQERSSSKLLSGMAQGVDQAFAHAALDLGIPVVAVLPFEGQESRWPTESRLYYQNLLARCSEVVVVSTPKSRNKAYYERDKWLVDNSDSLLAVFDGDPSGGTHLTVSYAESLRKPVINLYLDWINFRKNYCR